MTHSIWDFSATPASNNMTVPQGWPEGQLPSTVNDCARELIAMVFEGLSKSTVAGGSADALTITFTNAPTAPSTLVDGMQIAIRAASANATNAPTLAINGGTARTITLMAGKAVGIGEWVALQELILRYNLANTRWELLNPITGLHLIQTQVASTSATIDFTTGLDGTYNEYLFSLSSIIPATNATVLNMRISTDAGSTWKAGATDYNWNLNVGSSAATNALQQHRPPGHRRDEGVRAGQRHPAAVHVPHRLIRRDERFQRHGIGHLHGRHGDYRRPLHHGVGQHRERQLLVLRSKEIAYYTCAF